LALQHQMAPPTTNVFQPDEECKFDLIRDTARAMRMDYAMTNSFGFGGTNASLIFRREAL
jgi:3-oxoacyl-[acyl-carrier-protein] synthase II